MLKAILIDIFPSIISLEKLNNAVWKSILNEEEVQYLHDNEQYTHWLNEDLSLPEVAQKFIEDMEDVEDRAKTITDKFKKNKSQVYNNYFKEFQFSKQWIKFFDDAHAANVDIILNNNFEPVFDEQIKTIKLPKDIYTTDKYGLTSLATFEQELSAKNVGCDEFLFISNDQSKIDTLAQKGCFCVKIDSNEMDEDSVHHISSIKELDFGNLSFHFYNKDEEDDDGGL